MNAETLFIAAMNDRRDYESVFGAIKRLRDVIDHVAERVAKENAAWHDDPEADDHAAYHAPASEQFPRELRDEATRDLVAHYLTELTLSKNAR